MPRHRCPVCDQTIFARNTRCLACDTDLVYRPGTGFLPLSEAPACANRPAINCNWAGDHAGGLCASCRHTTVLPDLSVEGNAARWEKLETEKRPLIDALFRLRLPLEDASGAPWPKFEFKGDSADLPGGRVLTGHEDGVITLNIIEADDAERARIRENMGEPYRTLAGHFRHEVAHHYWEVLAADHPERLTALRAVFGDDREDYGKALERHYSEGAPAGWETDHVSSYATAHAWEDFAETWAHLFHILVGLETAAAAGLIGTAEVPGRIEALIDTDAARLVPAWTRLSIALNELNHAMGHETFYPFVLGPGVVAKLEAIRTLIRQGARA